MNRPELTPPLLTSPTRAAITALTRTAEPALLPELVNQARMPAEQAAATQALALQLARGVRERGRDSGRAGLVQSLLQEFALSSQEGVALMCLAEALLRIPDAATRDALIRDKISQGDWQAHLGQSPSLFVNAATWGLLLTGRLVATHSDVGLTASLRRIIGRGGEPLIRTGVDRAMRLMGEQFVTGETIAQALANARPREAQGFRYSYDMLGEAALTATDAERYCAAYEAAIEAIGEASAGRGILEGPGISIKLSALHPRYSRAQVKRVRSELAPRLLRLAQLARRHDIGLNIDAEESDRLELSLDLLEGLCLDPTLAGWHGIGFVIQAYQKRCPAVVDHLIDLARRSGHRLMIRLVKGAYWDSEIKRAQLDGLDDYPVYTRKAYTDVAYLACARKLLAAPDVVYPQFATHNAQTLAAIAQMALAGGAYHAGQYEFQCLHGMGEPLYEQIVLPQADPALRRPCRIYAPVGSHDTLLAYLVRRLLENGANTSFVNRIADEDLTLESLVEDPVRTVKAWGQAEGRLGAPHPAIPKPAAILGTARANARGLDLASETTLSALTDAFEQDRTAAWRAAPQLAASRTDPLDARGPAHALPGEQPVRNPADRDDVVGFVRDASLDDVQAALEAATAAAPAWATTAPAERAACLDRAAAQLEADTLRWVPLLVREAGKTCANAVAEVREAVDFLRFYAAQVRGSAGIDSAELKSGTGTGTGAGAGAGAGADADADADADASQDTSAQPPSAGFDPATHRPLGPVVCISPWNFPLAIFAGQVAAALAAGNTVLAKPAEQTPLIAAAAVRALHAAGIPLGALQCLPGPGEVVGAALVADARVQGVLFTGSTEVARLLQRSLAGRLGANGQPMPLIAETGGQNAMVVDSSALAEQAVQDAVTSAFDSAGQRCSALRVLCVQREAADRVLPMLEGAMRALHLGDPRALATDVGPVIDAEAQTTIEAHLTRMRAAGRRVVQPVAMDSASAAQGSFVAPALVEIESIADLQREVFGPVLHVLRYERAALGQLLADLNASGYGLTGGVHTRIDETVVQVAEGLHAGNLYVNRNVVGAVVGVQPFGGEGLSGTGPKAGGPLYLLRLLAASPGDAARRTVLGATRAAVAPVRGLKVALPGAEDARLGNANLAALRDWAVMRAGQSGFERAVADSLSGRALTPAGLGPDSAVMHDGSATTPSTTPLTAPFAAPSIAPSASPATPWVLLVATCDRCAAESPVSAWRFLPGPTGEANLYAVLPREAVLCLAPAGPAGDAARLVQLAAVLAVGSRAVWPLAARPLWQQLPDAVREHVALAQDWTQPGVHFDAVLHSGPAQDLLAVMAQVSARAGAIVGVTSVPDGPDAAVPLERLVIERCLSINTAAAGGNASLMTLG